jgi:hypothetical protein
MNNLKIQYIREMVREVAKLAETNGADTLAYMLRMAEAEADELLRKSQPRRKRGFSAP